ECFHESGLRAFLRHIFRGTAECPAAPIEANDHRCNRANADSLNQALRRVALQERDQERRGLHKVSFAPRRVSERVHRTPGWDPVNKLEWKPERFALASRS